MLWLREAVAVGKTAPEAVQEVLERLQVFL
jgi:hypothetical protein